jgi:Diaphanous GTPase-binding Domain
MATHQGIPIPDGGLHHKRVKSSVLKTFIHKRTLSKGSTTADYSQLESTTGTKSAIPVLPSDHPYSRALGELQRNEQTIPLPAKHSREERRPSTSGGEPKPLHKKTKSVISLKSLTSKDADKHHRSNDDKSLKMKKPKSSTNLAALLTRPRSSKNLKKAAEEEGRRLARDKENRTPPNSSPLESCPPIYAQFATQNFTTQPSGAKFIEDEIDLYTPQEYSPSKQHNFYDDPNLQPTLGRRDGTFAPRSMILPSSFGVQDISRFVSGVGRRSADQPRRVSSEKRTGSGKQASASDTSSSTKSNSDLAMSKRGSRVMAAVASLSAKLKVAEAENGQDLEIKDVDAEFEGMLDRRNIPEHQRHKMRNLALSMKIDLIKQDWAETTAAKSRPGKNGSDELGSAAATENAEAKTKRPRSRTFTLSKSSKDLNSTAKKAKPEATLSRHSRTKSSDSTPTHSKSFTSTGAAVASNLIAKAKGQLPDDFVLYLRKVTEPEFVEVGKLHKLRLLLRNETVAWTDEFIGLGGMNEIVGLLHRTMEVEWRFAFTILNHIETLLIN